MYSAAIPSLLGLLPLYFFAHYWLDKWLILRVCRMPPRFHISLNDRANNIFGFAIFMHILADVWFFGTPSIFPREVLTYDAYSGVKYYYAKPIDPGDRFLNPAVSTYRWVLAATIGDFLVEPVVLEVTKTCCFRKPRRGQHLRTGTLRTYSVESLQKARSSK